jgi:hypothetical protein
MMMISNTNFKFNFKVCLLLLSTLGVDVRAETETLAMTTDDGKPTSQEVVPLSTNSASGSDFYKTRDNTLFVKGLLPDETELFASGFEEKQQQHIKNNPSSRLLPFQIGTVTGQHNKYLVMKNILPGRKDDYEQYDLKGKCTLCREVGDKPGNPIKKDCDFVSKIKSVSFDKDTDKEKILQAIEGDVEFLKSWGINDYSLLLASRDRDASHTCEFPKTEFPVELTRQTGIKEKKCLTIHIVDTLRVWAKTETILDSIGHKLKGLKWIVHQTDRKGLMPMCRWDPEAYAEQFLLFMKEKVFPESEDDLSMSAASSVGSNNTGSSTSSAFMAAAPRCDPTTGESDWKAYGFHF